MAGKINKYLIFHYHFDKPAGTERSLYNLLEYLSIDSSNHITLILAGSNRNLVFDVDKLPINIEWLDVELISNASKLEVIKYYYQIYIRLKKNLKGKIYSEASVIITTNVIIGYLFYRLKCFFRIDNMQIVSCEHFAYKITSKFTDFVRNLYYKRINVVMLTKHDTELVAKKFNPKKCTCIPNALPFIPKSFNKNENNVILAIGRLTYQKGFDLLLNSFSLINNKFPDWTLKIVGDDFGDKFKLEKLIQSRNISNVEVLPSTDDIESFYREATFFVLSSRFEGLPMVLIEAMGFGLPIVAFDCPTGPSDVVDETNGFLVENGNELMFAESMEKLISNRNLLIEKSKGSEEKIKLYLKSEINLKWDKLFESI
jgi:glycosyltransferase involved in cell wall biosynthesis